MVFWFGPFLSSWDCKHDYVEHLAKVWRVTGRKDHFDDQQSTIWFHHATTVAEDSKTLGLAPVVYDVRKQVNVTSCGDGLEKAATFNLDAVRQAARANELASAKTCGKSNNMPCGFG